MFVCTYACAHIYIYIYIFMCVYAQFVYHFCTYVKIMLSGVWYKSCSSGFMFFFFFKCFNVDMNYE